jgi:hypothetical protein
MKQILYLFYLLPLFCFSQETITISGYMEEKETGEKLIGATIYDLKSQKGTITNDYGFFSLTIPKDSIHLKVSYIGFKPQFYLGSPKSDITFNFKMESIMLDEVEILSDKDEQVHLKTEMSTIDLSMQKVKTLPALLGENDIMKTIQLLPGVQSGSEGTSGIYVRGGGPDQNLILLDGVPVYNASHLFGFFSVFNADAINSTKLVKGGFPARYGGRLSSVIDIKMKEGNMKEFHGEGSIGLISSKLTLEGPIIKDKTSFLISARRTYLDILAQPIIRSSSNGNSGGYYFYDVNAKINHKFSEKDRLYISHYMGKDRAYLNNTDTWTENNVNYTDNTEAQLTWGNIISAIRWNHMVSNKIFMNTTLRYSRYNFLIGADNNTTRIENGNQFNETFSFAYNSGIEDWSGKLDFDWMPNPNHLVKFGIGDIYHTFTPGVNQFSMTSTGSSALDTSFGSQLHFAHELFSYIEDEFKLGNKLKGNIGLHVSGFLVGNSNYISYQPRFSGRYLLNESSSLKFSYAAMTQFLHLLTNTGIGMPTDLWLPATEQIAPQFSEQWAIGYATTIKNKFEISVEGYYKTMDNLIEYKDGASFFNTELDWQQKVEVGRGWSYGGELLIEKKVGKTTGWIGYTLSWTNRQFENLNFGEVFPYRYDRRHDIGIAVTHEVNENINMGFVWVYGTGNAVTLGLERYRSVFDTQFQWAGEVEHIEQRNNYRMPAYHRLDISINFKKEKKWGERTFSVGVYNIYNRQNPFYLEFGYDDNNNRQLFQYSLFPLIPSINYAFKF